MYMINTSDGQRYYSNTIIPICVSANGCYITTRDNDPDGFVGKIRIKYEQEDEEGTMQTIVSLSDTVFVLPGHTLKGIEPEAEYTPIEEATLMLTELEEGLETAYKLLYGEISV